MSLNAVMDSSLTAMFMAQAGMSTTSHNIANANTPGYSRQMNMLAARRPLSFPFGAIGQGVDVVTIRRSQDQFLLNSLRTQMSKQSSYGAVDSTLYEIEQILGSIDNDHLGIAMDGFFTSWSELATAPTDPTLKAAVVAKAMTLVADFHNMNAGLDDLAQGLDDQIEGEITSLNVMLQQIGELNGQIMAVEVGGQPANDLRDQRDYVVNQLSAIAAVTVDERDDGSLDIILGGRTMVVRDSVQHFTTAHRATSDGYRMDVVTEGHLVDVVLPDGRLRGLLESRDTHVTNFREDMDRVASVLINAVNELHVQGTTGSSSGQLFFTGDSMYTIDVSAMLQSNPEFVATSRSGEAADTDIANEIAALHDRAAPGEDLTVGDHYRSTLVNIASKRSTFEFLVNNQTNAVTAVEQKIASVAGVSLDEEAANMVRYQNTYAAAARVISTVQEMFDTLVNMI